MSTAHEEKERKKRNKFSDDRVITNILNKTLNLMCSQLLKIKIKSNMHLFGG